MAGSDRNKKLASVATSFKKGCRRALAGGVYHSGLLHVVRRFEGSRTLKSGSSLHGLQKCSFSKFGILCYHRVGTEGVPYHSRLKPRAFEAQMRYLKRHYRLVSLAQLLRELESETQVQPTLAITFDDGYADLYTHVFSVLSQYEIPATVYLIGESVQFGVAPWYDRIFSAVHALQGATLEVPLDGCGRFDIKSARERSSAAWEIVCYLRTLKDRDRRAWCREFERSAPVREEELQGRMLGWRQVREMSKAGVSFGAHTWTHPALSRLSPDLLSEELSETKALIEEQLQIAVLDFAYPFGKPADRCPLAEKALYRCGYRSAVTTTEGINSSRTNFFRLRRMQIGEDPSISVFAFSVARLFLESAMEDLITGDADFDAEASFAKSTEELT